MPPIPKTAGRGTRVVPVAAGIALTTAAAAGLAAAGGAARVAEIAVLGAGVALTYAFRSAERPVGVAVVAAFVALELAHGTGGGDAWLAGIALIVIVAALRATALGRARLEELENARAAAETRASAADLASAVERELVGRRVSPVAYELERAARHGRPVSVVSVVPDQADADALIAVAAAIAEAFRLSDVALQQGEADFTLVLPETPPTDARTAAERLRLHVAGGGERTVSVGIAGFPADGSGERGLVDAARKAAATARERGGNRTLLCSVPVGAPAGWGVEPPATIHDGHRL